MVLIAYIHYRRCFSNTARIARNFRDQSFPSSAASAASGWFRKKFTRGIVGLRAVVRQVVAVAAGEVRPASRIRPSAPIVSLIDRVDP